MDLPHLGEEGALRSSPYPIFLLMPLGLPCGRLVIRCRADEKSGWGSKRVWCVICALVVILVPVVVIVAVLASKGGETSEPASCGGPGLPDCTDRSVSPKHAFAQPTLVAVWPFSSKSDVMRKRSYGTCMAKPQRPLRWESSVTSAETICCNNRNGAEQWGYWTGSSMPKELPEGETITFYDSVTARPLFVAPVGRSYEDFITESKAHGWPSFRDAELVRENVFIFDEDNAEIVSLNGTHLGHNLPDEEGNRYCINLVCISGQTKAMQAANTSMGVVDGETGGSWLPWGRRI